MLEGATAPDLRAIDPKTGKCPRHQGTAPVVQEVSIYRPLERLSEPRIETTASVIEHSVGSRHWSPERRSKLAEAQKARYARLAAERPKIPAVEAGRALVANTEELTRLAYLMKTALSPEQTRYLEALASGRTRAELARELKISSENLTGRLYGSTKRLNICYPGGTESKVKMLTNTLIAVYKHLQTLPS